MTADNGSGGFIDGPRTVPLDDVGGGNQLAATVKGADYTFLAIVDCDQLADGTPMRNPRCGTAEHENTGPLPPRWRARIQLAPLRCGHRTKSGRLCRNPVQRAGDRCSLHRDEASR